MTAEPGEAPPASLAAQGVVLVTGLFGLVAQTLLFRDFLAVFEGNELGIAWFFASWLIWVAVGALIARSIKARSERICRHFEFLPLLYVPAYLLQSGLIGSARVLAGVETFELFPLARMLPVSFLANCPVSICTGLLFSLGCHWLAKELRIPVARVYVLEAAGGAAGGIGVTLLLACGAVAETLFLGAALLVALATCVFRILRRTARWSLVPVVILAVLLAGGADRRWNAAGARRAWRRIMPAEDFLGSFTTPHAGYLYGYGKGQFNVVSRQTIADTVPNLEHASQVVAVHLAQCPSAEKFLVIGPGSFSVCGRLLDLEQTKLVTWLDTDPDYPRRLLSVLPAELKGPAERLDIPGIDVRRHLAETRHLYDMVIINLPDITTLTLNRYFTKEFFALLGAKLSHAGIVGVRTPGAENFMGTALANTGAAVHHTLCSIFTEVVLKPGTETWLIASNGDGLSMSPAELRDRFAGIPGAKRLYPPEALMSLYVPDRIAYQSEAYADALSEHGSAMLINTDREPKALLYSLLFAAQQAGTGDSLARFIAAFARSGVLIVPVGILLYVLTRVLFRFGYGGRERDATPGTFDHHVLVVVSGILAMGVNLALMFMYQSAFGSIFLHVGLVSALFMLGLAAGGIAAERLLSQHARWWRSVLGGCCACHLGFVLFVCVTLPGASRTAFCLSFFVAGLLSGVYVPVAASKFRDSGIEHLVSGSAIEMSDHMGGAFGGVLVGLLLIPAFGSATALHIMALLIGINLLPVLPLHGRSHSGSRADLFARLNRPVGYAMAAIAAFAIVSSLMLAGDRGRRMELAFRENIRSMAGGVELTELRGAGGDDATLTCLVSAVEEGQSPVYFVCSDRSAPDVYGYGGPVTVAVMLDPDGVILDLRLLPSDETPVYVASITPWLGELKGRKIYSPGEVDAVSGATLTSRAVLAALRRTGNSFAADVLGLDVDEGALPRYRSADPLMLVPVFAVLAALFLRRRPGKQVRRIFLLAVVALLGVLLNFQYSLAHVFPLLGLRFPVIGFSASFMLLAGVPLLVLLFGNVYCGYLCPFGAIQELIGDLRPGNLGLDPGRTTWRYGRAAKYILLFVFTIAFAGSLRQEVASPDPLIAAFSRAAAGPIGFTFLVLGLSFVFRRFWCRNLCPTGAFLAILGKVRLVRRLVPRVAVKLCDLGVESDDDLDCICCDRCRRKGARPAPEQEGDRKVLHAAFLVCVLFCGLLLARATLEMCSGLLESERPGHALRSGGEPRNVDMRRLRGMIERGRLSGHEAKHYRRADEAAPEKER